LPLVRSSGVLADHPASRRATSGVALRGDEEGPWSKSTPPRSRPDAESDPHRVAFIAFAENRHPTHARRARRRAARSARTRSGASNVASTTILPPIETPRHRVRARVVSTSLRFFSVRVRRWLRRVPSARNPRTSSGRPVRSSSAQAPWYVPHACVDLEPVHEARSERRRPRLVVLSPPAPAETPQRPSYFSIKRENKSQPRLVVQSRSPKHASHRRRVRLVVNLGLDAPSSAVGSETRRAHSTVSQRDRQSARANEQRVSTFTSPSPPPSVLSHASAQL